MKATLYEINRTAVKIFWELITPLDNSDNVEATKCDTFFAKYRTLLSCYEAI